MIIQQLSIFVENSFGKLSDVLNILSKHEINIRALSMSETDEFGILRVVVDDTERASKYLRDNGFILKVTDVLSVTLSDHPGGLAYVVGLLKEAGISIEYIYAFIHPDDKQARVVLKVDDREKALAIFS